MSVKVYQRELRKSLKTVMKKHGFKEEKSICFYKPIEKGFLICNFPARVTGDVLKVTLFLGVKLNEIEKLLSPESLEAKTKPILLAPIHFLKPKRQYFEWRIESEDALDYVVSDIDNHIKIFGLPFFEEHSSIDGLEKAIENSPSDHDKHALGFVQISELKIAIKMLKGETHLAETMINEVLARKDFEKPFARNRIIALQNAMVRIKEIS